MEIEITIHVFAVLKESFEEQFEMKIPKETSCTSLLELLGKQQPQPQQPQTQSVSQIRYVSYLGQDP